MPRDFANERKEADAALKFAEETFGSNHPMVAARLENLANLLREEGKNLLEAANFEARAKVIRSKFENEEFLSGRQDTSNSPEAADDGDSGNNAFGQYKIVSKIGAGGMGTVYSAQHDKIDKLLAIKVLSSELVNSKSTRKRFEQEIQAACNLTHPHLVSVYDFGISKRGAPYLVMDFIDGVTLADEIKELRFIEKDRALNICIQICEGIAHAHAREILHRDIKPSNIMLSESGDEKDFVKVVDFGLAKLISSPGSEGKTMTSTTDVVGSPFYMSPEQCLGEQLDQRSDIYAIGCVMHETFSGKPPFAAGNTIKIIFQHLNADRNSLLHRIRKFKLQPGLERIIIRCLQKRPKDRYQSVKELLTDLHAVKSGKPSGFAINKLSWKAIAAGSIAGVLVAVSFAMTLKPIKPSPRTQSIPQDSASVKASGEISSSNPNTIASAKEPSSKPAGINGQGDTMTNSPAPDALATATVPKAVTLTRYEIPEEKKYETITVIDNTYKFTPGKHFLGKLIVSGKGKVVISDHTKLIFKGDFGAPIMLSDDAQVNAPGDPTQLDIVYDGTQPIRLSGNAKLSAKIKAQNSIALIHDTAELLLSNQSVIPCQSKLYVVYDTDRRYVYADEDLQQQTAKRLMSQREAKQLAQQKQMEKAMQQMQQTYLSQQATIQQQERNAQLKRKNEKSISDYKEDYAQRIQRHWDSVASRNEKHPLIMAQFRMDRSGHINEARILLSSRDKTLDQAALSAIEDELYFPPPPESYGSFPYSVYFQDGRVRVN